MPYKSGDIPSGTENVPSHGQAIYRAHSTPLTLVARARPAHAIAWAAVKRKLDKQSAYPETMDDELRELHKKMQARYDDLLDEDQNRRPLIR
jgi:cation transport regulator ChaB